MSLRMELSDVLADLKVTKGESVMLFGFPIPLPFLYTVVHVDHSRAQVYLMDGVAAETSCYIVAIEFLVYF